MFNRGTGVKPLWELPRPVVPDRQYSVKKAGSRGERKTSRPPARVLYWQTERGYAARHTLFFISASDETTPRRRSGPALPRPAPHYNAPAAVARLRSLWSLLLTIRYSAPFKCACGRGAPGHKVRGGRRGPRGRQNARAGRCPGLFRATLRRSIGPAPGGSQPALWKVWPGLLPLSFKMRLVVRARSPEGNGTGSGFYSISSARAPVRTATPAFPGRLRGSFPVHPRSEGQG